MHLVWLASKSMKYRITCDELILRGTNWQPKEYAELLEVLKPVSVRQVNGVLNLFEGLFLSPILKNVKVDLVFGSAESVAKKFLATCQNLEIRVTEVWDEEAKETSAHLELFKIILQLLFSEARPYLKQFTFVISMEPRELPSVEQLTEELSNFNVKEAKGTSIDAHVHLNLPLEHYPEGSRCELTFKSPILQPAGKELECGKIYFNRG